jgi:REP element-mobilizing transposase RayT
VKFEKFPFKLEKQFRLNGFDYSSNGYYFVTICTKDRLQILGSVVGTDLCVRSSENNNICSSGTNKNTNQNTNQNNNINLSEFGNSCNRIWLNIPQKFKNVILDDFIIMPDHIHGIILIKNNYQERTQRSVPTTTEFGNVGLLGQIIRWFKTMSTNEYINGVKKHNWPKFNKQIWQTRFHDRIIRSEKEYFFKKQYINNNPKNWEKDKENV